MKLALLALLVCCLAYAKVQAQNVCVQRNSCSCVFPDKRVVDLSPLAFNNGTPRWSNLWDTYYTSRYSFNPCYNFTENNCTGVSVCRFDGVFYTNVGSQQSASFVTNSTNGHQAIIYNSTDSSNKTRTTRVELVCIYEGPDTLTVVGETDPNYYVRVYSHARITLLCLAITSPPPHGYCCTNSFSLT
ncbi:unnamed protein product, partial [Candidula unifasciata]